MSQSVQEHRQNVPQIVRFVAVTISDTRNLTNDTGGETLISLAVEGGFQLVGREIIPDDPSKIKQVIESWRDSSQADAVLLTGGTGISSRDQTFETVSSLLQKQLPGYGELFRQLSYHEIGPAAILSRAVGGLLGKLVVLTMPGSPAGVRLAMSKIIVPELPHLVREANR